MSTGELFFGLQALRQEVESLRKLDGALGLRARALPFQCQSAARVLADERVRHLLADEVGFGKTIEALMVMAALRRQDPTQRFLVLVPDHLARQWAEELLSRWQTASSFANWIYRSREELRAKLKLGAGELVRAGLLVEHPITTVQGWVREGLLDELLEIMLIDEANGANRADLKNALLDRLGPSKPPVTLLTPKLLTELGLRLVPGAERGGVELRHSGKPIFGLHQGLVIDEYHALPRDLLDQIDRAARHAPHLLLLTATPPLADPARLGQLLRLLYPEQCEARLGADAAPEEVARELEFETRAARVEGAPKISAVGQHRAILRAERRDWRGYFPSRALTLHVVEPTSGERQAEAAARGVARALRDAQRDFRSDRLLQRAARGAASLADWNLRNGRAATRPATRAALQQLGEALREPSDSALDALLDLLTELWDDEPGAAVVIAVGDNPTLDAVRAALLDLYGLERAEGDTGQLFEIRQGVDEVVASEQARAFATGARERVLLVAGEGRAERGAYVGLNLQRARHLVLFSVPWRHDAAEQLIGRVDRLGSVALERRGSRAVEIHALVRRGSLGSRALEFLKAANIFERPLALSGPAVESVAAHLEVAALSGEHEAWRALVEELSSSSAALGDALDALRADQAERAQLPRLPDDLLPLALAPEPCPGRSEPDEAARLAWLQHLDRAGVYTLAFKPRLARAGDCNRLNNRKSWARNVETPEDLRLDRALHFALLRARLTTPPDYVAEYEDGTVPLGFLAPGSALLGDLTAKWLPKLEGWRDPTPAHALELYGVDDIRGWVLVVVTVLDPGATSWRLPEATDSRTTSVAANARRADQRMMRILAPPTLTAHAFSLRPRRPPEALGEEAAEALLTKHLFRGGDSVQPPAEIKALLADGLRDARAAAMEAWRERLDTALLLRTLEERHAMLAARLSWASEALERVEGRFERDAEGLNPDSPLYQADLQRLKSRAKGQVAPLRAEIGAHEPRIAWLQRLITTEGGPVRNLGPRDEYTILLNCQP